MFYGWFSGALFLFSCLFAPSFLSKEKTYSLVEKSIYHTVNIMEKACLAISHFEILEHIFRSTDVPKLDFQYDSAKESQSQLLKNFNSQIGHEISEYANNPKIFWKLKEDIEPALEKVANDPAFQNLDLGVKACALTIVQKAHQDLPQKSFFEKTKADEWNKIVLGEYPQQYCLAQLLPFSYSQEKLAEASIVLTALDHLLQSAFYTLHCPFLIANLAQGLEFFRNAFHALPLNTLRSLGKMLAAEKHWLLKMLPLKGHIQYAFDHLFYEVIFDTASSLWRDGLQGIVQVSSKLGFLTCKSLINTAMWVTKKNIFLDTSLTLFMGTLQYYWMGPDLLLAAEGCRLIKRWIAHLCGQKKSTANYFPQEVDLWKDVLKNENKIANALIEKPYHKKHKQKADDLKIQPREKDEEHAQILPKSKKRFEDPKKTKPKDSKISRASFDSRDDFLLFLNPCRKRLE